MENLKKIQSGQLHPYSETPVREWETLCKELKAKQVVMQKTTKKTGIEITYPTGLIQCYEEGKYPSCMKDVPFGTVGHELIELNTCWGVCKFRKYTWDEIEEVKSKLILPEKPNPIEGFDWSKPSQVCDLINEKLKPKHHVSPFDLCTPNSCFYEYTKTTVKEAIGEPFYRGDCEDGYSLRQSFKDTNRVIKIYPSYWEIWEYTGGLYDEPVRNDPSNQKSGSSRDFDGMWNK